MTTIDGQIGLYEQLRQVFSEELLECVELFNRDLLVLERDGRTDEADEAIRRMVRSMHGVKGAARMVQAKAIEDACHVLEDVLQVFQQKGAVPELAIMQLLFTTVDGLANAGRQLGEGVDAEPEPLVGLTVALREWIAGVPAAPESAQPQAPIEAPMDDSELDARMVALHRDLGRWLAARNRLPPGSDSTEFLARLRRMESGILQLSRCIDESLEVMNSSPQRTSATRDWASGSIRRGQRDAHLLVVDDSPTMRVLQRARLEEEGYQVTTARDGAEGLELFLRGEHDLIIMDVEMPNIDGFGLTAAVRGADRRADVPIVMVTGLAGPEDRARAIRAGVDRYLVKSLAEQGQLVAVVDELLARRYVM